MKAWNNFKERHLKCVKTIKWIVGFGGAGIISLCGYKYLRQEPPKENNSWTCHYRKDGKPKIKYSSKERANLQVVKDLVLHAINVGDAMYII